VSKSRSSGMKTTEVRKITSSREVGENYKWFSFTGQKHGGEAGAKEKAEQEKRQR